MKTAEEILLKSQDWAKEQYKKSLKEKNFQINRFPAHYHTDGYFNGYSDCQKEYEEKEKAFNTMFETLSSLENDDESIPTFAWEWIQSAINEAKKVM